ncbi:hypothetical protein VCHA53O466_50140 [Vibrio chagasii]|nr:hypothetical protein VCHA53O466_50140 [Vibrio chagasii]
MCTLKTHIQRTIDALGYKDLRDALKRHPHCDIVNYNYNSAVSGMKISIQGKCVDDSIWLYDKLSRYLHDNEIGFKLGTAERIGLDGNDLYDKYSPEYLREQSHKLMTIYCPLNMEFSALCETVYELTKEYRGWYDVPTPSSYEHYAGGLYTRRDLDENGNYIPANR